VAPAASLMVEVAQHNDFLMGDGTDFGGNLRGASIDMLSINNTTSAGMDDVDKLLQAFQPGEALRDGSSIISVAPG